WDYEAASAACLSVWRIQPERVFSSLDFIAFENSFNSASVKRTGTIRLIRKILQNVGGKGQGEAEKSNYLELGHYPKVDSVVLATVIVISSAMIRRAAETQFSASARLVRKRTFLWKHFRQFGVFCCCSV